MSGNTSGAAAELVASRKCAKYVNLPNSYNFQPIAFESLDTLNYIYNWPAVTLISVLWLQDPHKDQ